MRQTRRCALQRTSWNRRVVIGLLCSVLDLVGGGQGASLQAQTSITSSGLNTAISGSGTTTFIDGGTRPGGGPNLFHSFGEFSIGEGHTALFRNSDAAATSNIFGRVTGNSVSNIYGTIDTATNFPTANLWLINPNGFLFGPTAALNVGGSVNISTADYLKMTDGTKFNALPGSADALLSMAPVAAFGFTAPRPILIQGSALAVLPGKVLSIVGGDLEITGRFNETTNTPEGFLFAPSGQIQLSSVASAGEVAIATTPIGLPGLNVGGFSRLGHISLSEVAVLNTSGNPGGTAQIRAGSMTMDRSSIVTDTQGNVGGQTMAVDLNVAGRILLQNGSSIITSDTVGGGRSGDIVIKSGTLDVTSAARITSSTSRNGNAGDVSIQSSAITLTDSFTQIGSITDLVEGNAGSIVIDAKTVDVDNGAGIGISTLGKGGVTSIIAQDSLTIRNSGTVVYTTLGDGDAGRVQIRTPTLTMQGGGGILWFNNFLDPEANEISPRTGPAGSIDIAVRNAVLSEGAAISTGTLGKREGGGLVIVAAEALRLSGSKLSTFTVDGAGGRISVLAHSLTLSDKASIRTESIGTGPAGSVTLQVARLTLTGGSFVTSNTVNTGLGATVTITASEQVLLNSSNQNEDPSRISSNTLGFADSGLIHLSTPVLKLQGGAISSNTGGPGNAGIITVKTNQLSLTNGAEIISTPFIKEEIGDGNAGMVNLQISGLFSSQASRVSSEGKGGAGGNVSITAGNIRLTDGSTILTKTAGLKDAGGITLTSGSDIIMRNTTVTTSADQASGGNIKLTAPNVISLFDSTLSSSVNGPPGSNGGNISIDPVAVSIQNSQLLANANAGAGGNINVVSSGAVLVSPSSVLDASAGPAGVPGRVNIDSPIQVLGGTLVPLKVSYSQAALSGDRCAADPQGQFSSFVQTGRDGVPPLPGAYAPSPLFVLDQLLSSSRGSQLSNLTARRLGLDSVGPSSFQFQSACRS